MSNPTRIRAQVVGGKAIVRVLMSHDMESGQRKDSAGKLIPAWHITEVTVSHNGQTVLTAEWGPGVSRNPFLQLVVKDARVGDKLGVVWKDNQGDSRAEEASFS